MDTTIVFGAFITGLTFILFNFENRISALENKPKNNNTSHEYYLQEENTRLHIGC